MAKDKIEFRDIAELSHKEAYKELRYIVKYLNGVSYNSPEFSYLNNRVKILRAFIEAETIRKLGQYSRQTCVIIEWGVGGIPQDYIDSIHDLLMHTPGSVYLYERPMLYSTTIVIHPNTDDADVIRDIHLNMSLKPTLLNTEFSFSVLEAWPYKTLVTPGTKSNPNKG